MDGQSYLINKVLLEFIFLFFIAILYFFYIKRFCFLFLSILDKNLLVSMKEIVSKINYCALKKDRIYFINYHLFLLHINEEMKH